MHTSALSQVLGFLAALTAGAFLVNLTASAAPFDTRLGLWGAWSAATTTLVWAGGAFSMRTTTAVASSRTADGRSSRAVSFLRASLIVGATIASLVTF